MLRCVTFLLVACCTVILPSRTAAAETPLAAFERVDIAPTKTSIYIGSVSLTTPTLVRSGGVYATSYVAKVFPYFFHNESGELRIEFSDEMLRRLERGEVVEFKGNAVNEHRDERRIEGKATPANPTEGKIKVRVFVSKRIELIFNTTYRFPKSIVTPKTEMPKGK